jgi:hypothetical protein
MRPNSAAVVPQLLRGNTNAFANGSSSPKIVKQQHDGDEDMFERDSLIDGGDIQIQEAVIDDEALS